MNKKDMQDQLDSFIEDQYCKELSKKTLHKYRADIQAFLDWLPENAEITKKVMIDYKNHLKEKTKKTTSINSYITAIDKFVYWLDRKDLALEKVKSQIEYELDNVIDLTDYKRLIKQARRVGQKDTELIMRVLAGTGIRIEELKYFTVENLGPYIDVTNKGKTRSVPIRRELLRDLRAYCRDNKVKSGTLFPGRIPEQQLTNSAIWKRFKKLAGMARVNKEKVYPHSFRHFFALEYLEAGGLEIELADILGHSSLETTRIYVRATKERKREKMERMRYK
ncbi:tyrosine-type recombinase/integrase [Holdemania massiliensis]|uniref:tyrosine-type recombinase/integrase n=1 Tax=Holdemania massiliensis TaxID=1468449 RepID=UPI002430F46D|nr:tyrosine-type recombinase/integrase [Holdemania massiliensis]